MTLVKIGQTILNFDLVTVVRDLSTNAAQGPLLIEFSKGPSVQIYEQAATLRAWLDARVVAPTTTTDPASGPVPSPSAGA